MTPYALTVFTGAFLLFQVQPLIGKFVLPWFGGSPGVWTACLLFFQVALLGGYGYAHLLSERFSPRAQAILHVGLLVAAVALLPIAPSDAWKSHLGGNPIARILWLLTACIGLPYFMLSATGPLIQQWSRVTHPHISPYRLYALSNGGSLLALLSYPSYFERQFSRATQATFWAGGLIFFVLSCAYCAWRVGVAASAASPAGAWMAPSRGTTVKPRDTVLWLCLSSTASVLLLATTNRLCLEVASVPLLWLLPLGLYLLSFIFAFDHCRWYYRRTYATLCVGGVAASLVLLFLGSGVDMILQIAIYSGTLFVACMVCHGELYLARPPARSLTAYLLTIAAGGALGAALVSVVAPLVFNGYWELPIGLCVATLLAVRGSIWGQKRPRIAGAVLASLAVATGGMLLGMSRPDADRHVLSASRNFYGTLKVIEHNPGDSKNRYYVLVDGATTHGLQRTSFPERTWPTTYYSETSGVARAIAHLPVPAGHRRLGLVGLGAGTLAAYAKAGDTLRIYEINPDVRALATSRFTYLASSSAQVKIVMGDARVSMERELAQGIPQQFDLLVLDAFSSDAIPVHLLTQEAVQLYWQHLKPGGVLAIHTSNRYLDLVPVVKALARYFGTQVAVISDDGSAKWWVNSSTWVLLTTNESVLDNDDIRAASVNDGSVRDPVAVWTDERASLFEVLR